MEIFRADPGFCGDLKPMGAKILDPRLHGDDITVVFHCFRKVVIPAKAGHNMCEANPLNFIKKSTF